MSSSFQPIESRRALLSVLNSLMEVIFVGMVFFDSFFFLRVVLRFLHLAPIRPCPAHREVVFGEYSGVTVFGCKKIWVVLV